MHIHPALLNHIYMLWEDGKVQAATPGTIAHTAAPGANVKGVSTKRYCCSRGNRACAGASRTASLGSRKPLFDITRPGRCVDP